MTPPTISGCALDDSRPRRDRRSIGATVRAMTNPDSDENGPESPSTEDAPSGMVCDFCGEVVSNVSRVALDGQYDRLRKPHQERYACSACSSKKESQRLGLERS